MNKKALFSLALKERDKIKRVVGDNRYIGNYTLVFENGETKAHTGRACYLALRLRRQEVPQKPVAFLIDFETLNNKSFSTDEIQYTDWWINKSFASDAFLTKEPIEALEKGVILSTEFPASYAVTACMGLRYIYENEQIVKNWIEFRKYVNENIDIVLAHKFKPENKERWAASSYIGNTNHVWVGDYFTNEMLRRIINKDFTFFKNIPPFRENTDYHPLGQIWSNNSRDVNILPPRLPPFKYPKGKKIEIVNSWGNRYSSVAYEAKDMEEWLKKTVLINRLKIQ